MRLSSVVNEAENEDDQEEEELEEDDDEIADRSTFSLKINFDIANNLAMFLQKFPLEARNLVELAEKEMKLSILIENDFNRNEVCMLL